MLLMLTNPYVIFVSKYPDVLVSCAAPKTVPNNLHFLRRIAYPLSELAWPSADLAANALFFLLFLSKTSFCGRLNPLSPESHCLDISV
jgi:hypothetical protein